MALRQRRTYRTQPAFHLHRKNTQRSQQQSPTNDQSVNQTPLPQSELFLLQRSIDNRTVAAFSGSPDTPRITKAEQVLALQRVMGNKATARLLTQTPGLNAVQRWPWTRKNRKPTPGTTLAESDKMRTDPNAAQQNQQGQGQQNQQGQGQQKPPPFLSNITPSQKQLEDPDYAAPAEALSFTGGVQDFLASALGDAGGTLQSAKYDSVFKDFLKEQGLPANTKVDDLTDAQAEALEEKQVEEGGLRTLVKDADTRTDLGIASSGVAIGVAGATSIAGIIGFAVSLKKLLKETDSTKRTDLILDLVNQGALGAIGGLQSLSSTGGTIAGTVSKYQPDNESASAATASFGGIGEMFGGLGSFIEMFVSGVKTMRGGLKLFKGIGEGSKKAQVMQITSDFIQSGKSFLATAKSVISAVRTFMEVAGKANAFTSAVPIVGAAVNIAIQFLDIALQIVDGVKQAIKIAKARRIAADMQKRYDDEVQKGAAGDGDKKAYLQKMIEINIKRVKRAIIPLVTAITNSFADVLSIAGSILNIVGAATSAAYGAGVAIMATGYAATGTSAIIKLGGAAAKPIAAGVRTLKQKGRDRAAKVPNSKFAKVFNKEKSTDKKQADYIKNAQRLFDMITALPDKFDANNAQEKAQYEEIYLMLKATGVNTKELFGKNGSPKEQMLMVIEAMQVRE